MIKTASRQYNTFPLWRMTVQIITLYTAKFRNFFHPFYIKIFISKSSATALFIIIIILRTHLDHVINQLAKMSIIIR